MSDTVCATVLDKGEIYDDRAFVVDDWYITAYEPIHEPDGQIIGALYVGLLEAPYARQQRAIVGNFLVIAVAATLVSLALLIFVTRLVLSPIGRIVQMCRRSSPAISPPESISAHRAKWDCSARLSTRWGKPSRNERNNSN